MSQTSLPADGYLGDPVRKTAEFQQAVEDVASVIMEMIGGGAEHATVTLASGAFAPTVDCAVFPIEPETGTTDDLATITSASCRNGSVVIVRNDNAANTITIKHGTGNIYLSDDADYSINDTGDYIAFILQSTSWIELFRTQGNLNKVLPGAKVETSATVASGMLPITQAINKVIGEGSAADNLDGISSTFTGNLIVLRTADASDAITVRNNQAPAGGYYTILTLDGASVVLDSLTKYIVLHKDTASTSWREILRGGFIPQTKFSANYGMFGPATSGAAAADPTQRRMVLADMPTAMTLPQQVRLYTTTGNPGYDSASASLFAASVYIGPYGGNMVCLPDSSGDVFTPLTFSELTQAVGSDEFRIKDVFLYNNSGTVACELNAWDSGGVTSAAITGCTAAAPAVLTSNNSLNANDYIYIYGITGTIGTDTDRKLNNKIHRVASATGTTITLEQDTTTLAYTSGGTWVKVPQSRTDALTLRNGVYLKNSDKTRLYVGTIMLGGANGAGTVEDWDAARNCWSYFNRLPRRMKAVYSSPASHTYTTATTRPFNRSTKQSSDGVRFNCVIGVAEEPVQVGFYQMVESTAAGGIARASIAIDNLTGALEPVTATQQTNVINQAIAFSISANILGLAAGAHFLQYLQYASGGSSMTWHSGGETAGNFPLILTASGRW